MSCRTGPQKTSGPCAGAGPPGSLVAYIVGHKEFGLTLQVDARVLVPRPDTETLVDWASNC